MSTQTPIIQIFSCWRAWTLTFWTPVLLIYRMLPSLSLPPHTLLPSLSKQPFRIRLQLIRPRTLSPGRCPQDAGFGTAAPLCERLVWSGCQLWPRSFKTKERRRREEIHFLSLHQEESTPPRGSVSSETRPKQRAAEALGWIKATA